VFPALSPTSPYQKDQTFQSCVRESSQLSHLETAPRAENRKQNQQINNRNLWK
jgi:hypothetical protein